METGDRSLDDLALFELQEDPDLWEQLVMAEQERAKRDSLTATILESVYWEADRDCAFRRFRESLDFAETLKLLDRFGIERQLNVVEIGGGSGFLSWALAQSGYQHLSLLEPNRHYVTGTGYLRSRADASRICIENSIDDWHASKSTYDAVITRNCVHHFPNITCAAAGIRQKIKPQGHWIMIREPYVESARQLYEFLQGHPYSQRYGVYEFSFPAAHFVSAFELAGFRLKAVVPAGYANNSLSVYADERGGSANRLFTQVNYAMLRMPSLSVALYRLESAVRRLWMTSQALFTRPQMMLFQRVELGRLPASAVWYGDPSEARRLSSVRQHSGHPRNDCRMFDGA